MLGTRRCLHSVSHDEDAENHDDFADENESPGELRRHPAADDRADCHGGPGDAADDPISESALLPLVIGRGQRGDGRDHEHGSKTLDEGPADKEDLEVRAQRRRQ